MAQIFVTGITGFVGTHLTHYLVSKGHKIFGLSHRTTKLPQTLAKGVHLYYGNILDQCLLEQILKEIQPDIIYHLAGILKATDINKFYLINVLGTIALFEAIIALNLTPKVLIASSSAVYGPGFSEQLITEQFPLQPITHYAISKIAQETVALRYYLTYQLPVVCVRTFNLIGPNQPAEFACSAFARQIAIAELTKKVDTLTTGNLSTKRDFTDIRDVVCAYDSIVISDKPDLIYNVCSAQATSIKQCLDILLTLAKVPLKTIIDPNKWQPNDVAIQIGSAVKIYNYTGWRPKITLQQSLEELLNYWRQQVKIELSE